MTTDECIKFIEAERHSLIKEIKNSELDAEPCLSKLSCYDELLDRLTQPISVSQVSQVFHLMQTTCESYVNCKKCPMERLCGAFLKLHGLTDKDFDAIAEGLLNNEHRA